VSAGTRYITAVVRREVCERDDDRCRFIGRNGQRCVEKNHLEFHHRHPYAYGGGNDAGNLSLMCRTHNAHLAEADYGKRAMAKFRQRPAAGPVP
jgi:5-methylcytosine-specific restriction endonuclease McrA